MVLKTPAYKGLANKLTTITRMLKSESYLPFTVQEDLYTDHEKTYFIMPILALSQKYYT